MAEDRLTTSLSESVLTLLGFDKEYGAQAMSLISPEIFEPPLDDIAARIIEFRNEFKEPPGQAHLDDIFDQVLSKYDDRRSSTYRRILEGMLVQAETLNSQYIFSRINQFVREQRVQNAIAMAGERYLAGGDTKLDDVERIFLDAIKGPALNTDLGLFLDDTKRGLEYLDEQEKDFCYLGIGPLDARKICPTRGEFFLLVAPRKSGKCIEANSLVLLPNGLRKPIWQVVRDRDPEIMSFDTRQLKLVKCQVSDYFSNGAKPCIELQTSYGRRVITTLNHKFLTQRGWKEVKDINTKVDYIAVPKFIPELGTESYNPERLRLLAYLIADGALTGGRTTIRWTKHDPILVEDFRRCIASMGDLISDLEKHSYNIVSAKGSGSGSLAGSNTFNWLEELGLKGKKSNAKHIPDFVFRLSDRQIQDFLRALLSSDGCVYGAKLPKIEFTSASEVLAEGVYHLLIRLGFSPRIKRFAVRFNGKVLPGYATVFLRGKANILLFNQTIGFVGRKQRKLLSYLPKLENVIDKGSYNCIDDTLGKNFRLEQVTSIEDVGLRETYDLTVQPHHNFLAQDILVHNTHFCVHCGKMAVSGYKGNRWDVVHITLEVDEHIVVKRYHQSMLSIADRNESYKLPIFERDDKSGKLKPVKFVSQFPKYNYEDKEVARRAIQRLLGAPPRRLSDYDGKGRSASLGSRFHNLVIKRFPSGMLTFNALVNYLDALESIEHFIPDMLIVDYPQLMHLDTNNYRLELGQIGVKLRGLAVERNMAVVAVAQGSRLAERAAVVQSHMVAEDISLIATADNVITLTRGPFEKMSNTARLLVSNARNAEDGFQVCVTQSYSTATFVLDSYNMGTLVDTYVEDIKAIINNKTNGEAKRDDVEETVEAD